MKLKRILIIILTVSMIFSNTVIGFAEDADAEETYGKIISRVNTLLSGYADKDALAIDLYLVKLTLDGSDYLTLARNWLDANPSAKTALLTHGLNDAAITDVINSFKGLIPTEAEIKDKDTDNVFALIYQNLGSSFDYKLYTGKLKIEIRKIYDTLPITTKDALHKFDRNGSVPVEKVFVELMAVLLDENAGNVYYNTSTGKYFNQSYAFDSGTKDKIIDVLNNYKDTSDDPYADVDTSIADSLGESFVALGNSMINIGISALETYPVQTQALHKLLVKSGLVNQINYTPTVVIDNTDDTTPVQTAAAANVNPVSVDFEFDAVNLEYGTEAVESLKSYDFANDITIAGTNNNAVTWTLSDTTYATVDANGIVTTKDDIPLRTGNLTLVLTVRTVNGGATDTVRILFAEKNPQAAVEFLDAYISGYPDGTFRPTKEVSRAEVATMFAKILKLDTTASTEPSFIDVPTTHWAFGAVEAMYDTGLFVGYLSKDGVRTFQPESSILRGESAQVFSSYWTFVDLNINSNYASIPDVPETHWAVPAINRIYNAGIFEGFDDGTFKPDDATLREQIVSMINRFIGRPADMLGQPNFSDVTPANPYYGDVESASKAVLKDQ